MVGPTLIILDIRPKEGHLKKLIGMTQCLYNVGGMAMQI